MTTITITDHAAALVAEVLARRAHEPGALLPVLHEVQDALGCIPRAVVPQIAQGFNLSRAEVHGVISYYRHFRQEPAAGTLVQVCQAEACQAMGAEALMAHAQRKLGCGEHGRSADGAFTLEPVYCLGLCSSSPAVAVGDEVHGRVTLQRFDELLDSRRVGSAHADSATQERVGIAHPTTATTIYVPRDSAALARGADQVAGQIAAEAERRGTPVKLVRNGSRGLFWLEPLVEVLTPQGRIAYGPVGEADVAGLFDAGLLSGAAHPLRQGPTEDIAYLKKQQRWTFARMGVTDPLSLDDYRAHGGFAGLRRALTMAPAQIVQEVLDSGLRGRGGAAFPAGIKWQTVLNASATQKYIVCNADEGDSGTYSDRMTMEGDPFMLIEGMVIAGLATGATQGYVYVRSEYPHAVATLDEAIVRARAEGYLGAGVLGSAQAFDIEVRKGAGSYVCGEETAMLESLEGKRGVVRAKPPLPALAGLFGRPTVVNNVITLATVPRILAEGAASYSAYGVGRSRGTLSFQLAGNIKRGGLVEAPLGVTLRELLHDYGGGSASGRPIKAVQVGGPLGSYVPPSQWDVPLDFEAYAAMGASVGHGGIVVHDDSADMAALARYAMAFCALESCGKCTPCRIGAVRGAEVIDRLRAAATDEQRSQQEELLRDLCDTMKDGSLCAMGGMTPYPVLSALNHYPQDFGLASGGTV